MLNPPAGGRGSHRRPVWAGPTEVLGRERTMRRVDAAQERRAGQTGVVVTAEVAPAALAASVGSHGRPAPRLRGVIHAAVFPVAIAFGVVLVAIAPAGRARVAALVYAIGLCACFGTSAVYHRGRWSPGHRPVVGRIDHAMIFLLIAGTWTPVLLLAVGGALGSGLLVAEWTGALAGIAVALGWRNPPVWAEVGPYLIVGWLGVLALPALMGTQGAVGLVLMIGGGLLYTVGAICYALERPDPWPSTFGFHEIFHGFVTVAASGHAVLVALLVLAVHSGRV